MSKESLLLLLGCLVAITTFLGVPIDIKRWVLAALGLVVAFVAYLLRMQNRARENQAVMIEQTTPLPFGVQPWEYNQEQHAPVYEDVVIPTREPSMVSNELVLEGQVRVHAPRIQPAVRQVRRSSVSHTRRTSSTSSGSAIRVRRRSAAVERIIEPEPAEPPFVT